MQIGRLDAVWRYPTKSLHFESLDEADVDSDGIRGDRTRALVVTAGHARLGKPYRGTEHDGFHLVTDGEAARVLAAERGVQTEERGGERFFDAAPISILVDRWLDGLSAHLGYAVQPGRFRPNLFVRAADGFSMLEEDLVGWELALGPVRLRVRKPIERCVVTTYDPGGGASDPRVLRYVARERKTWMGIYCDVVTTGVIRPGDALLRVLPDA
jgi:uncharacterized protein YcbX